MNDPKTIASSVGDMVRNPTMRSVSCLIIAVLVLAAVPTTAGLREVGTEAPGFSLRSLDGTELSLSNLRGKPVFLEFWTTWCGVCRQQIPAMNTAHEKFGDAVQFVLINTAEGDEVVRKYVDKMGIAGAILLDPKDDVGEMYGTEILPTYFLVDADGTIRAAHAGALANIDSFVAAVLPEGAPSSQ